MPATPVSPQPPPDEGRPGTLLETDEEIRKAQKATKPVPTATGAKRPSPERPPTNPYRPAARAPVALLTVCDDGKSDGEVLRIRSERFVIGRSEGDFLIPQDESISARHLEISRHRLGDRYRWVITDLQTTNGLFIRVSRTILADRAEFLVGGGRYRFEAASQAVPETVDHLPPGAGKVATRHLGGGVSPGQYATLVELVRGDTGARVPLTSTECWIGTDSACAVCRPEDPFVEPRHVRVFRDAKGAWHAQNNKSANGLWYRVPQITVEEGCLFQIGEQRFRLKVGG